MVPLFQKIKTEGAILTKQNAHLLHKIHVKSLIQASSSAKVAKLIKTFKDPSDLHIEDLNPLHLLKPVRGSGFSLDLSGISLETAKKVLYEWKLKLEKKPHSVEFLIEEKLNDKVYGITATAVDYKFFCFHGKPVYFLCRDGDNRNFYDLNYKPLKLESTAELERIDLAPMIQIAKELSAPFPFVRIDLYNCKDGVYFGEYTFHCRKGAQEFPMALELYFGSLWKT
jgi:hypothetical protein